MGPWSRRQFLVKAGRLIAAGTLVDLAMANRALAQDATSSAATGSTHAIYMKTSSDGNEVYFDPVGVLIKPGDTIRWYPDEMNYHTVTAYHPQYENHELRIPVAAKPWDTGLMLAHNGNYFEVTLCEEGVYDYYCRPHEEAGMVGRIIVGRPLDGPGTKPFGYSPSSGWKSIPEEAQTHFPAIAKIMAEGVVHPTIANP